MVSQNRLKLDFFKMQHFFCNIYPRPAQYFQNCRFHLLLKCIPPTHVYGILTFKRDITQLYSKNSLKMPKCVFFSKFSYLSTFTPVFSHMNVHVDIIRESFILLWLMYTLPILILNINTFPVVIWLVNRILCHFRQFLPPYSSIFPTLLDPTLPYCLTPVYRLSHCDF
jgi:hypothetical protein